MFDINAMMDEYVEAQTKGLVPSILKAIDTVKRNVRRIALIVIAVSTPHQMLFIFSLTPRTSLVASLESLMFAFLIPLAIDYGMITTLKVTQTVGLKPSSKKRAALLLAVLVTVSAVVNFIAPGNPVLRCLFGFMALLLAGIEWVSSAVAADFPSIVAAAKETEAEIAEVIVKPAAQGQKCQPGCKCKRHPANRQAKRTRKPAAPKTLADLAGEPVPADVAAIVERRVPAQAPTSPAVGWIDAT